MILDEIAAKTRIRIAEKRKQGPEEELREKAYELALREKQKGNFVFPFEEALKEQGMSFICEVKKASPSKGIIAENFPYIGIAEEYEQAGASALSVLTEPFYFKGSDTFLEEISRRVKIPILRKDFTIDAYMLYEAKVMGASAVLLICAILMDEELKEYIKIAGELGLSALVETHTSEEVKRAVSCGAKIIGVNNRDLQTFQVDLYTSEGLRNLVPEHILYISESGIKTADDIRRLEKNRIDAVLIGETLMRSPNRQEKLEELKGVRPF